MPYRGRITGHIAHCVNEECLYVHHIRTDVATPSYCPNCGCGMVKECRGCRKPLTKPEVICTRCGERIAQGKRRSERILSQAPVIVEGRPIGASRFVEPTRAQVINAHGALISLMAPVNIHQKLMLRNPSTQHELECLVVYLGEKQGGRTEIGVAFRAPDPLFGGLENLPQSWKLFLRK